MAEKLSAPRKHGSTSVPQTGTYRPRERISVGPQIGFAVALLVGCIAWASARSTLPPHAVVPVVSTLVLAMAGAFALIAWRQRWVDPNNVSYLDVAGVLTLIGICVAATIDPEQLVLFVQGDRATD